MHRRELENYTQQLLETDRFKDYAPNGLQVEGRDQIRRLVTGVSASLALIEAAIDLNADAILVHHGYFWKNEDSRIVGMKHRRLKLLLANDINLFGYHLPLDAHPVLGNNAQLGMRLNLSADGSFGDQNLGRVGSNLQPCPLSGFAARISEQLDREPLVIGDQDQPIRRVAWCTGGAQGYFSAAVDLGVDAYLTGEISEPMVHIARETGVAFISAGHHATERYGIQALGQHLAEKQGLEHYFIDISNPV